nr:unnamed protein product [Callosobruchus chinensis]
MYRLLIFNLIIGILGKVSCHIRLQILKNTNDFLSPVSDTVEEKVGASFSLICMLIAPNDTNSNLIDDNLSWIRTESLSNQTRVKKTIISNPGINKSEKRFDPLKVEDVGNYYCISKKFNLSADITISVIDNDIKLNEFRLMRDPVYCNDQMFHCKSDGLCIISHYVCDGKPDCKDGSDETIDLCRGEPCKDKIPCEDGRCIPSSWCCDRHLDVNCMVTNKHICCQSMVPSESYEELESGYPSIDHNHHFGARYLFISVCIVSILFSIVLLLLIVTKVVIFAKKSALQQQRHNFCDGINLRNQTNVNIIRANFNPTNIYTVRGNSRTPRTNIIIDTEATNPLLFNGRFNISTTLAEQPPSYVDVVRSNRLISEPPPPYTSREILNVQEEAPAERS